MELDPEAIERFLQKENIKWGPEEGGEEEDDSTEEEDNTKEEEEEEGTKKKKKKKDKAKKDTTPLLHIFDEEPKPLPEQLQEKLSKLTAPNANMDGILRYIERLHEYNNTAQLEINKALTGLFPIVQPVIPPIPATTSRKIFVRSEVRHIGQIVSITRITSNDVNVNDPSVRLGSKDIAALFSDESKKKKLVEKKLVEKFYFESGADGLFAEVEKFMNERPDDLAMLREHKMYKLTGMFTPWTENDPLLGHLVKNLKESPSSAVQNLITSWLSYVVMRWMSIRERILAFFDIVIMNRYYTIQNDLYKSLSSTYRIKATIDETKGHLLDERDIEGIIDPAKRDAAVKRVEEKRKADAEKRAAAEKRADAKKIADAEKRTGEPRRRYAPRRILSTIEELDEANVKHQKNSDEQTTLIARYTKFLKQLVPRIVEFDHVYKQFVPQFVRLLDTMRSITNERLRIRPLIIREQEVRIIFL
jgi:hypothetical protein